MVFDRLLDFFNRDEVPNKFTRYIGSKIREAREEKRISQVQLAESIYKRRASISEMETGKMIPDVADLTYIALELEKPITFFIPPFAQIRVEQNTLSDEEIELISQFRHISDEQKQLALKQIMLFADFDKNNK